MNTRKIIGWVLLGTGLLVIFLGLYSSFNIFTARKPAPEIFKVEEEKTALLPEEQPSSVSMEKKNPKNDW